MHSIARVRDTTAVVTTFGIRFSCFILLVFFFVRREVHMSCIGPLILLWCIHVNARVVAEFFKKLPVLLEGFAS